LATAQAAPKSTWAVGNTPSAGKKHSEPVGQAADRERKRIQGASVLKRKRKRRGAWICSECSDGGTKYKKKIRKYEAKNIFLKKKKKNGSVEAKEREEEEEEEEAGRAQQQHQQHKERERGSCTNKHVEHFLTK
jgi:hypothetical protein